MTRPTDSQRPRPGSDPATMTFGEHLEDLRRRVIHALLGIVPIFVAAVVMGEWLMELLMAPAQRQLRAAGLPPILQSTGPLESIGAYLKVTLAVTIIIGVPWIVLQLWLFVAPGLHQHEKRFARLLLPMSAGLASLGLVFLYFVMLPAMLLVLINFGASLGRPTVETGPLPQGIELRESVPRLAFDPEAPVPGSMWFNTQLDELRVAVGGGSTAPRVVGVPMGITAGIAQQYRIGEYTGLIFFMALAFSLGFQTPVVVLLAGWMGVVEREFLARNRKYAVFLAALASAVLTPSPDPFSMMVLAAPLYLLYELGLLMLKYLPPSRVARGFMWGGRRYGLAGEPPEAGE